MNHAEAREHAKAAYIAVVGKEPSPGEVAALAGVARLETGYGAWGGVPSGVGSNNMGAIQAGSSWTGQTFSAWDTHPNKDGTSTRYESRFRKYATPFDGFKDLVRTVFVVRGRESVRVAAEKNDWDAVSANLHKTGYYEGFGKTIADRIANHAKALKSAIKAADTALGVESLEKTEETEPSGKWQGAVLVAILLAMTAWAAKVYNV